MVVRVSPGVVSSVCVDWGWRGGLAYVDVAVYLSAHVCLSWGGGLNRIRGLYSVQSRCKGGCRKKSRPGGGGGGGLGWIQDPRVPHSVPRSVGKARPTYLAAAVYPPTKLPRIGRAIRGRAESRSITSELLPLLWGGCPSRGRLVIFHDRPFCLNRSSRLISLHPLIKPPPHTMTSTKPVALVVGASRGIGRQIAIGLADNGYAGESALFSLSLFLSLLEESRDRKGI